ncbi:MAG: excinuclease ABC subunit UvrA [Myxococcales bacterium]|nr:excinuclease ABC subunit UvrA [Myxococcales bacterium]
MKLSVVGAAEHNLRGVDVQIEHGSFTVVCGVSGSGKTSLAFDTLHAESQRRFVESMTAWVRAQVGQAPRPAYEQMTGLLPSIGVAQRGPGSASVRATVATSGELYDLFRVLYARAGTLHCPGCGDAVVATTVDVIVRELAGMPDGTPLTLLARVARGRTTPLAPLFTDLSRQGFLRGRVDGVPVMLDLPAPTTPGPHDVELVVDRMKVSADRRERLQEAVATALRAGRGALSVEAGDAVRHFATRPLCARCERELPPLSPRLFSFNSPVGACRTCQGVGQVVEIQESGLVDARRSLADGAVLTWSEANRALMLRWAEKAGIATDVAWSALPWEARDRLLQGEGGTEGIVATAKRRPDERWTLEKPCPACAGARLSPEARAVRCGGRSLPERLALPVAAGLAALAEIPRTPVTAPVLEELERRLSFLVRVGLDYITLDRAATTLSGGEWQRLRLGAQIGNQLSGVLYVLDEPTAGLHPEDTGRLVGLLRELCQLGNTVLVVEHDPVVLDAADHVIEVGPGAGVEGGRLVFSGTPAALRQAPTLTGRWLRGELAVGPHARLTPRAFLGLEGLSGRWLRGDAALPLGVLAVVTGPSGAGKSSLIFDTLAPALLERVGLPLERLLGQQSVTRVVNVDGSPLAKAGRSTVATATRIFETIRQLYARTPEAKARGFGPERFSTAVAGGRCEACQGEGSRRVSMHVLPDVVVPCEVCEGRRFDEATLSVTWKGHSVADVLAGSVRAARGLFGSVPAIAGVLETLDALGLGYLPLGQGVDSLSGGEAQRLKLARELGKPGDVAGALYLLDEPSIGLHPADVAVLVEALRRLVTMGGSVIAVEHDPIFIAACDWEVRMGPGAGPAGGRVVASGATRAPTP